MRLARTLNISRGLDAQATAIETTDPDLAVEHLMATIRIGGMLEHEGLLIHGLVGIGRNRSSAGVLAAHY